tara:strand:- start:632 stop:1741 length:1110 start_codon:yes stop_codon:yes gene_type:complete
MDLYMCKDCGHHQLVEVVDPEILYGSYIYTSSSSPDLKKHFLNYAEYLNSLSIIKDEDNILDVGCNDGLFLNELSKFNLNLFGIDPAPNIKINELFAKYTFFSGYCNKANINQILKKNNIVAFDIITANNVFAHADNLEEMLASISDSLKNSGYFIFEVSYILDMLESNVIDYIYHEHLSYHGIKSLLPFLKNKGLYIFDIKRIKTKGGSIRVVCSKNSSKENKDIINKFINLENLAKCYQEESFEIITKKIGVYRRQILKILNSQNKNLPIISYGAAPTSIVNSLLLQYDNHLAAYIDDNPIRQNTLAPNTFIPVLSPKILEKYEKPLVIIGAWRFEDLIVRNILRINKKCKIIIPSLKEGLKFINFD